MLPLWNSARARIYLAEDHVLICLLNGHRKPQVQEKIYVAYEKGQLLGAFPIVDQWLSEQKKKLTLEWVLGGALTRHIVLPWSEQVIHAEFRQTLADALLTRQFQLESQYYEVRFAHASYGQPLLATFVEKELLQAILNLAQKNQCVVKSIEPLSSLVWDRFLKVLEKEESYLLIIEQQRISIIHNHYGHISDIELKPFDGTYNFTKEPATILGKPIRMFNPNPFEAIGLTSDQQLWLESGKGFSIEDDCAYSYALCGVF
ncbi:hypothetical protein [Aquirhabdus sp.]|uniref:hypothetical protein n=1 Tax=Aquirhabdus sp. TaxID=2824160 RepID=UPI00396CD57C